MINRYNISEDAARLDKRRVRIHHPTIVGDILSYYEDELNRRDIGYNFHANLLGYGKSKNFSRAVDNVIAKFRESFDRLHG